jgi:hypothetical protein
LRAAQSAFTKASPIPATLEPINFHFAQVSQPMKPLAPGTVIFHRHRGYGVIISVNLLTGWISARFGSEVRTLDLNLSSDEVQSADGEPILFRRSPPDRMPHARLMAMVRELHRAGYQRLYLYSWPKPSGLHWRWHLFAGQRNWMQRPWREGWYGSGADYNFNPVLGWGDSPGASPQQLAEQLVGRTTLVIAHRFSTIQRLKRIVVMQDGKVVAQGSHAELMAGEGLYARLANLQFSDTTTGNGSP